jgi:hypothetical protein
VRRQVREFASAPRDLAQAGFRRRKAPKRLPCCDVAKDPALAQARSLQPVDQGQAA